MALVLAACPEAKENRPVAPAERPNVVIVTWDTVRWDHVGADPQTGVSPTPNFDRFAQDGIQFSEARTTAPITLAAHTSIMTGLQPPRHGARTNGSFKVREDVQTLAEEFRAAGYATAAFVSAAVLHSRYGLDRGFEEYDHYMHEDADSLDMSQRAADATVDTALAWLKRTPADRPIFLWLHLFDPHRPWEAPAPWFEQFDPYRAEIAFADAQTGRLLDYLRGIGRLSNALLVMTADHGEGLGEHGEFSHGLLTYDSTLRVPLVIWAGTKTGVSLARGARIDGLVSLVDLAPTLRELAGLPPQPTDGVSLVGHLQGRSLSDRDIPFESVMSAYGLRTAPVFGVATSDGEVWIDLPHRERYHVRRDPQQLQNLYSPADEAAADAIFGRFPRDWPPSDSLITLEDAARDQLEALGYLAPPATSSPVVSDVDPKDRLAVYEFVTGNHGRENARRMLAKAQALRAEHGPLPILVGCEVIWLQALGRPRDALRVVREALDTYPDASQLLGDFKKLSQQLANAERAIGAARKRLESDPDDTQLRLELASLLQRNQDLERAAAIYREILAAEPDNRQAGLSLAVTLTYLERDDEALARIRALRAVPGFDAERDCELGDLLATHLDKLDEGREAIRSCAAQGVELDARQRALLGPTFATRPVN